MRQTLGAPCTPSQLSESTQHRLNMYVLAASAAGFGIATVAWPAEAKIIYTPANVNIAPGAGFVQMDVNNDGTPDFAFYNTFDYGSCCSASFLSVSPDNKANSLVAVRNHKRILAADLGKGFPIGPRLQHGFFNAGALVMAEFEFARTTGGATTLNTSFGSWRNVKNKYLGLKFVDLQGKTHYGWARLTVGVDRQSGYNATLTGYAYETIPNKAIIAGRERGPDDIAALKPQNPTSFSPQTDEPAALALLAVGAPGLSIWRRKQQPATSER
jgi:hypothetical protein